VRSATPSSSSSDSPSELLKALAAARETLYQQRRDAAPEVDPPTLEQQQADALALLAETALHHELDPGAPGERYQVVVHVDAAVLADAEAAGQSVLEDGGRVPAGASQRLACDASRVVMRHDGEGRVVEVGVRDAHDPTGVTARAAASRRRLSVPGVRRALRAGPSHPALGAGRADDALEPGDLVSPTPPRGA
jgi:hypothetical protein